MGTAIREKQLSDVSRWGQFIESTAKGLQLHLTLLRPDATIYFSAPAACPICRSPFPILTSGEVSDAWPLLRDNRGNPEVEIPKEPPLLLLTLPDGQRVMVRGCPCAISAGTPSLKERADIAHQLLISFQTALQEGMTRILGTITSAIILVDQHGVITYVNQAAEALLEKQALRLIGSTAAKMKAPWSEALQIRIEYSVSGQMDFLGVAPDLLRVDWKVFPLKDRDLIAGWLVFIDDRTEYYYWQEVGRQAEHFAAIATIIGPLAHELRNPLAAAKGLLQIVNRKKDPQEVGKYLDLVVKEMDRMNYLLNEFLLLGRPVKMASQPLDLVQLVQELMPLLNNAAEGGNVEVLTDLEPVPTIMADPGQLTQVIHNLVRNAVEAMVEKGRVVVSLRKARNEVVLAVTDNGPGIRPEVMEKIFNPFFTTRERGTGLGLSVIKTIVHNHGGKIEAVNLPDERERFFPFICRFIPGTAYIRWMFCWQSRMTWSGIHPNKLCGWRVF
jgi:signal transduction histidine kinase